VPLLVHLSALTPQGKLASAWDRRLVTAGYLAFVILSLARAVVWQPIRDPDCWVICGQDANPFLITAEPHVATVLGNLVLVLTVGFGLIATATTGVRLRPNRTGWPFGVAVSLPAVLALLAEAAYALVLLGDPRERFVSAPGTVLFFVRAGAILTLAIGVGWVTASLRAARRRVALLAHNLSDSPSPGELETTLSRTLRDDSLEIRYWLAPEGPFVDGSGRHAPLDPDDARAKATIVRGKQPVAVVLHDPRRVTGAALEAEIGSGTRLLIDNERLRAVTLAHLVELQDSRARIVAAGDELRRRVERDLHDGAQQRLLAASYELRLARAEAEAAGGRGTVEILDRAMLSAMAALQELREFAHGVFPAVLDEAGLAAALWSLADVAKKPVDVDVDNLDGVPGPVARAAYFVARSAVAAGAQDEAITLRASRRDGTVVLDVEGAGPVDTVLLGDRVGAVGGDLEVEPGKLRAVIPCE
jgi:signal transduction histidine kinase